MSRTQVSSERQSVTGVPTAAIVDLKLEVVAIPVSDVDRAKRFYAGLGWRSTPISWSARTFERCS